MKYRFYTAQMDSRDCGVAALSMLLKKHGTFLSLVKIRELVKTNLEGTSALGIVEAAKEIGFETKAIQANMSIFEMENIHYPFIAHVVKDGQLLHYYVVTKQKNDYVIVADPDPQVKVVKMKKDQFESEWTGVAIFITPTPDYKPLKDKKSSLASFIPIIVKQNRLILNIIIAAFLVAIINILGSYFLQGLIDNYIPNQLNTTLGIVSFGLIVIYLFQQILKFSQHYLIAILGQRLTIEVMLPYIKHVLRLPISFFATRRTGEIISRFSDANQIIDALANIIVTIFLDIVIIVIVSIVLLIQNIQLFFITMAFIPVYGLIIFLFVHPFERMNNEVMQANSIVSSDIIEDINGIETIKALSSERDRYSKIDKEFVKYLDKLFTYIKLESLQNVMRSGVQLTLSTLILWVGATFVISNRLSLGQLIAYNTLLNYFILPLENIINLQTKIQAAKVANNRLNEIFLIESEFEAPVVKPMLSLINGDIIFRNVSFKYGHGKNILNDISCNIQRNSKICILGSSGSGKTSMAKLLVNFFEVTEGQILLGETQIKFIDKKKLRQTINYLPQQPYIFSGTILENLMLGAPSDTTMDDVIVATKTASIYEYIEKLPSGFLTELTTDSTTLSGGQKQRIALARAVLSDASIMILDEATSNLDPVTEKKIVQNLISLSKKTIIFVTHSERIAQYVDRIVVIKEGKIIENGSFRKLVESNGAFYNLFIEEDPT